MRGYSQELLAERSTLSRQYISDLEQGKRPRPTPRTLARLARALDITDRQLRGCEPIPGLLLDEEALAAEAELEAAAMAEEAETLGQTTAVAARPGGLGLTSLLALPPGSTVLQRMGPDGSIVLYIRIPGAPRAESAHPPAHPRHGNQDSTAQG